MPHAPAQGYIVAGSDSGHAIIWERQSGAAVAALAADADICNVVQPHPHLPVLATAGIEDAVRLWAPAAADEYCDDGSRALTRGALRPPTRTSGAPDFSVAAHACQHALDADADGAGEGERTLRLVLDGRRHVGMDGGDDGDEGGGGGGAGRGGRGVRCVQQ